MDRLDADPACTGYIVQLPLPAHLDANAVLERMDPSKDADGLNPVNLGGLVLGAVAPLPCTPRGAGPGTRAMLLANVVEAVERNAA